MVLLLRSRYGVRQRTGYSATHSEFREAEARGLRRWVLIDHRGRADRIADEAVVGQPLASPPFTGVRWAVRRPPLDEELVEDGERDVGKER